MSYTAEIFVLFWEKYSNRFKENSNGRITAPWCEEWCGSGAALWQWSPRCLAKHPLPTSGTSCNISLSKMLSIHICIYTLVTHEALIKKAEQSWHGVPCGTAKVNRSWEAVSRVTVCWARTTRSLIKSEREIYQLPQLCRLQYNFYL